MQRKRKRSRRVIKLLSHQAKFLALDCPYPALVAGYGSGKSAAMEIAALRDAAANPQGRIGLYAPTYDLLKLISITGVRRRLEEMKIEYTYHKTDHIIKPAGMGELIFRSLDKPERIVGYQTIAAHIDELDTLKKAKAEDAWQKVIARNRDPSGGDNRACVYTTPEGKNFVWEKWGKATDSRYQLVRARTTDNPFLRPDYVENLRADYPEALVNAYINGEFCNLTSSNVYYAYDPKLNHTARTIQPTDTPIHVGMDFNITNMSAAIAIDDGVNISVCDEVVGAYDTRDMISILKARYGSRKLIIYPDASSGNRSTSSSSTDLDLLRKEFKVHVDRANPLIRDRVNVVLGQLANANGDRHLFINPTKCPSLCEAVESQVWNERTGQPDKEGGFDHLCDSLGYLTFGLRAKSRRSVGSSGVRIY